MSGRATAAVVGLAVVLSSGLSGCGGAEALGRALGRYADDLSALGRSRWVTEGLPGVIVVTREAVESRASAFAERVRSVPESDQWETVAAGCELWSAYDIEEDPSKAEAYVRDKFTNAWVYEQQVKDLATDLRSADGSTDQAVILGRALLCTTADEKTR